MSQIESLDRVIELAGSAAEKNDVRLYDLEFVGQGKTRTLRVYIDKEDGAVTINDCANVSNAINEVLETDESIVPGGAYNLEVSSPGIERPLKKAWHFQGAIGSPIWVKLKKPLGDYGFDIKKFKASKVITAALVAADERVFELDIDSQRVSLPLSEIEKAKTLFDFASKTGAKR